MGGQAAGLTGRQTGRQRDVQTDGRQTQTDHYLVQYVLNACCATSSSLKRYVRLELVKNCAVTDAEETIVRPAAPERC